MKTHPMKTNKRPLLRSLGLGLALGLGACNDLDEYNPSNATADTVWTTPEGFVTVVNAAYSEQRSTMAKELGLGRKRSKPRGRARRTKA